MSKQFKTWCRIIDFLAAEYPEIHDLVKGVCVDSSLMARKGKPGVTLIIPTGDALATIKKLAFSEKPADANTAADMLNAMIFRDVYRSGADWSAKKANIPNALFPSQHVAVTSASGSEVTFASGAKAVVDEKFRDSSRNTNLAVWKLTAGTIPVTTDKPAKLEKMGKKMGAKVGSYDVSNAESQALRWKIAVYVENLYAMQQSQSGSAPGGASVCVFYEYTCSLVMYLNGVAPAELKNKVLPVLGCDKIDFYYILEPHRVSGEYLVSDEHVAAWWQRPRLGAAVCEECQRLCDQTTGAAIYSAKDRVRNAVRRTRESVSEQIAASGRKAVDVVEAAYAKLVGENVIGDVSDVFPGDALAFYQAEPGLKMAQDELRFVSCLKFAELERKWDAGAFEELVNMIGESQHVILNKAKLQYMIGPSDQVAAINSFVWSTAFLHTPMTAADAEKIKNSRVQRPEPDSGFVHNLTLGNYRKHSRTLAASGNAVAQMLNGMSVANMDPTLKAAIIAKLSA